MREADAPVVGIVFLLAVIALELYFIYAIIATRQDVRVLRRLLQSPSKSPAPLAPSESVDLTKHAGLRATAYSDDWGHRRVHSMEAMGTRESTKWRPRNLRQR